MFDRVALFRNGIGLFGPEFQFLFSSSRFVE